jgi:PmbA protein
MPEAFLPRNGFRLLGGLRSAEASPGIAATNVLLTGEPAEPLSTLLARVGRGLYLGRLWYTYPINGLRAGDFTGTAVADSFLIRDGRLAEPLAVNAVRVNDNIRRLLTAILGIGGETRRVAGWGADEVILAPPVAVADVPVEAIGAGDPP